MKLAAEPDRRPVREAAAGQELRPVPIAPGEVRADPRLALAEEGVDAALGPGPPTAGRRGGGDDQPELGVDRDPGMARPRGGAGEVAERGSAGRSSADRERTGQRARPSRSVATAFSIRRWRVSSDFAAAIGSTQNRWLL